MSQADWASTYQQICQLLPRYHWKGDICYWTEWTGSLGKLQSAWSSGRKPKPWNKLDHMPRSPFLGYRLLISNANVSRKPLSLKELESLKNTLSESFLSLRCGFDTFIYTYLKILQFYFPRFQGAIWKLFHNNFKTGLTFWHMWFWKIKNWVGSC